LHCYRSSVNSFEFRYIGVNCKFWTLTGIELSNTYKIPLNSTDTISSNSTSVLQHLYDSCACYIYTQFRRVYVLRASNFSEKIYSPVLESESVQPSISPLQCQCVQNTIDAFAKNAPRYFIMWPADDMSVVTISPAEQA
jgi:hypothetical protein